MEITITEAAKDYLNHKLVPGDRLLLALDDGSSKYSKLGGTCAIGNKFQLVIADTPDPDYTEPLASNTKLNLTTGPLELSYLGHGLALDYHSGMLNLHDDSGVLDGAVTIDFAQPLPADEQARREEMKALGAKVC
ncbi:iron-sulfur cluster biosynthesis family protein [Lacticaseibacillus hegangensis]|uniref:Iron-sulfur cluster biosynthesis family protein n=1 Tax=Lacticaseibacillus hegangensis TaxID=2486010 RepID=A0ABW4D0H1_9LACO|nr:iron-sulfur cluster biosynthesis family protein [Lacticaseibacillus hegangensis]